MYKVKIASKNEFYESKDTWNKLASQMQLPSIFCTWEWIYTWWEHFGKDYKLLILFVYNDSEIKGILPLASQRRIVKNGGLIGNILCYCGSRETYSDHVDIICPQKEAELCLEAIFAFLLSEYKEWDVLNLSHISDGNPLVTWFQNEDLPYDFEMRQVSIAPFIHVSCSFDEYVKRLGSDRRYKLKRNKKRLLEQHNIRYMPHAPTSNSEGLKYLFDLHEQRAKSKDIESTFIGAHIFDFHNSLMQRLSKNGWVWLRFLGNEEKIVAVFYGFSFGKILSYYQMGFDPEWEYYSPGALILMNVFEEAFYNGMEECDLLRGSEKYKTIWTTNHRNLFTVNIYNKTFDGYLSKLISYSRELIKTNYKNLFIRA